jgi:hypothetical protein
MLTFELIDSASESCNFFEVQSVLSSVLFDHLQEDSVVLLTCCIQLGL